MHVEQVVNSHRCNLPDDRIIILRPNCIELAAIRCAVLFVYAAWSAPSALSFTILCDAISKFSNPLFPIIVVNADDIDCDRFQKVFAELPQGKGEAFWIVNGQISYRDHGYTKNDLALLQSRILSMH